MTNTVELDIFLNGADEASQALSQLEQYLGITAERIQTTGSGITNGFIAAIQQLRMTIDEATTGNLEFNDVITSIGELITGHTDLFTNFGVAIAEASGASEILASMQDLFADSAGAATDPITALQDLMANFSHVLGGQLIPRLGETDSNIGSVIRGIVGWMEENPALAETLGPIGEGLTEVTDVVGGAIDIFSDAKTVVKGFGTALKTGTGVIGWVIMGIDLLIQAGMYLYENWDKISVWFGNLWDNIKIIFAGAVEFLVNTVLQPFFQYVDKFVGGIVEGIGGLIGFFNEDLGNSVKGFADTLHNLDEEILTWVDGLAEEAEASKEARQESRELEEQHKQEAEAANQATEETELANEELTTFNAMVKDAQEGLDIIVGKTNDLMDNFKDQDGEHDLDKEQVGLMINGESPLGDPSTIYEVRDAIDELCLSVEEVREQYFLWNKDAELINEVIDVTGISAEKTSAMIFQAAQNNVTAYQNQSIAISAMTARINEYSEALIAAKLAKESFVEAEEESGESWGTAASGIAGASIDQYDNGGPILEDSYLLGASSHSIYAMAHKGEYVVPSAKSTVVIPISMDGKEIAKYVVNVAAQEARLQGVY